jgi:hypothetical protein
METCTTLFDTHVHLDLLPSQLDPVQEVARANRAGIDRFLIPGVQPRDWHQLLEVANSVPGALAALGTHPVAARQWDRDAARRLETLLTRRKVVALGEIGLDGTSGMPPSAPGCRWCCIAAGPPAACFRSCTMKRHPASAESGTVFPAARKPPAPPSIWGSAWPSAVP